MSVTSTRKVLFKDRNTLQTAQNFKYTDLEEQQKTTKSKLLEKKPNTNSNTNNSDLLNAMTASYFSSIGNGVKNRLIGPTYNRNIGPFWR